MPTETVEHIGQEADYYTLLGVPEGATPEQIKTAYRALSKRHHPDRLGATADATGMAAATAYMARINEAYEIIGDPVLRREYDAARRLRGARKVAPGPAADTVKRDQTTDEGGRSERAGKRTSSPPSGDAPGGGSPSWGTCAFSDLPAGVRKRLLDMRNGNDRSIFLVSRQGWGGSLAMLVVLVTTFAALVYYAITEQVTKEGWRVLIATAAAFGALIAGCAQRLLRQKRCRFGTCELFCPFYFVRADEDRVTWYRMADVTGVRPTHHYVNGSYRGTALAMDLVGQTISVWLPSKEALAVLMAAMRRWEDEARQRFLARDSSYFHRHALFIDLPKPGRNRRIATRLSSGSFTACCLGAGAIVGLSAGLLCQSLDESLKADAIDRYAERAAAQQPGGSQPVSAPVGAAGARNWAPSVPATIDPATPAPVRTRWDVPSVPFPPAGLLWNYTTFPCVAPLEVVTRGTEDYYVKLTPVGSRETVAAFFVRAGEPAAVDVPLGVYELKYAAGHIWYGPRFLFGPDTRFAKAGRVLVFTETTTGYSGYTVELYLRPNGNLTVQPLSADEF